MEIIKFNVCHQEICTDREKLVSDTIGSYKCHFNFDSSWDGLNKIAVFIKGKKQPVEKILDSNNECDFADELLDTTGTIVIGVYGTKDGVRYPTIKSKMLIVREGIVDGVQPTPPSLEIWEQLLNKIEEERQRAITKENALENALNDEIDRAKEKENSLTDLITTETNERINADNEFTQDLNDVHNLIDDLEDSKAEKDNTYTKAEVNQLVAQATPADYDEVKAQVETNKNDIEAINGLIPSQASEENQLADKEFVNSSIATNTATFIGTFNSVAELEAYEGTKTNNDYAFVIINDETTGFVKEYDRYKWNGTQWLFEYSLNNSSFTAEQWATINSGLTSQDVEDLHNALSTIEQIQTELANKMERVVLYLSQVNNVWTLKNEDGESLSFQELYNHCRNTSHYVVVLVGNSKLRPQYVSLSEIHCDGEDRDSQGSLFMRMIMTPSVLYYQTFRQAEVSDLLGKLNVDMSNLSDDGIAEIKNIIFGTRFNLVKEGLIDNPIVLTDEEKLKIETWLGLSENYLTYYNEMPYQVNGDYNPAHKKYVDTKFEDYYTKTEVDTSQAKQDTIIDRTKRSLDYLWKKSKGIIYDEESVESMSNEVVVPSGAMDYASLDMLGGMSRKGKNTIDTTKIVLEPNKVFVDQIGTGFIQFHSTISNWYTNVRTQIYLLKPNMQYTFSCVYDCTANYLGLVEIVNGDGTGIVYSANTNVGEKINLSFTSPADGRIMIGFRSRFESENNSERRTYKDIQLEEGSSATPYEPYTDQLIDAKVDEIDIKGKNLIDIKSLDGYVQARSNGLSYFSDSLGFLTFETTDNEIIIKSYNSTGYPWLAKKLKLKSHTDYYINGLSSSGFGVKIVGFKEEPKIGDVGVLIIDEKVGTFNTGEYSYFLVSFYPAGTNKYFRNVQIEEGTQPTSYVPYKEPITKPIPQSIQNLDGYGIGINDTLYNYFEKVDDKVLFHKRVGIELLKNITFNGRYEIVTGSGVYAFNANFAIKPPKNTSIVVNAISSDYVAVSYSNATKVDKSMYENTSGTGFRIRDDNYNNLTDFVNSLGNKVLYYELAEEEIIDVTDLFPKDFEILNVEPNGTIEFHYPNKDLGYEIDTPSKITYMVNVSEVA